MLLPGAVHRTGAQTELLDIWRTGSVPATHLAETHEVFQTPWNTTMGPLTGAGASWSIELVRASMTNCSRISSR